MNRLSLTILSLAAFLGVSLSAYAMNDPDLEGPITKINTIKNEITVSNVGPHAKLKNKEKRVLVKQGMVNNYKMRDYVQIRLMADNYEAKMIEKTSEPKDSASTRKG